MPAFRKIREHEIADIAILEHHIFPDAWSETSLLETFKQPQAFIAVAEGEDAVVGYCIFYHVMDEGEIARIGVKEEWRGTGIGQGLLDFVCSFCVENGIERLLLDVRESNCTARRFYEKYGFTIDGMRKDFYEQPKEHAVLMSMTIDKLFH